MSQRKVVIIFYEGYISLAPTIVNISSYLAENYNTVDVLCPDSKNYKEFDPYIDRVNILRLSKKKPFFVKIILRLTKIFFKRYYPILFGLVEVVYFQKKVKKIIKKNKYDLIIGVDNIGIITATLSSCKKCKILYLSLEIGFLSLSNELMGKGSNIVKRIFKNLEKDTIHKIDAIITQDESRFKLLCQENSWEDKKIQVFYLPNAPRSLNNTELSNDFFFRKKFDIDYNKIIVLSAGMVSEATLSFEIAKSIAKNSQEYVLVFHERMYRNIEEDQYLQKIKLIGQYSIYLSLSPLPFEEIYKVFQDCQIGLVIYNPSYGVNFSNIVFASGKLCNYLKFGKPVIANNLPGMREFIEGNGCGIVIDDFSDLDRAIKNINNNYMYYSLNAFKCFNRFLNFDVFAGFLKEI